MIFSPEVELMPRDRLRSLQSERQRKVVGPRRFS